MRMRERELHSQPLVGPAPGPQGARPRRSGRAGEGRGEVEVREVDVGVAVPGLLGQCGGLGG
jgi:hypothetical protein